MKQLTLQEQYNLIQEGKGNKNAFMKSALRQFPNLFNNLTEFNTAVGVLKQKSIFRPPSLVVSPLGSALICLSSCPSLIRLALSPPAAVESRSRERERLKRQPGIL